MERHNNLYSDYIIYVDESGDHGLLSINPEYPVFILVFCIFNKYNYGFNVVPKIIDLKFNTFGHDMVILHEHDIRKKQGHFSRMNKESRERFMEGITSIIEESPFVVIAVVINKIKHSQKYVDPANPYHLAMDYGLERVYRFLKEKNQEDKITSIICESRGRNEDNLLELEFRRVCDGNNYFRKKLPFEIIIADKRTNSAGLQIADMIARPIGLNILRPGQKNRAMEIIKTKFYCNGYGEYDGFGLKCFP